MHIELVIIFFFIAAIYASAGFGGGSSYLAVMALFGLQQNVMRPTSLMCNIVVVLGGTYIMWKNGYLNLKKIIPLSIASIPLAYFGGLIKLSDRTFFLLLGVGLVVAALLMFFQKKSNGLENKSQEGIPSRSNRDFVPQQYCDENLDKNSHNPLIIKDLAKEKGFWQSLGIGGLIGFFSGMVGIGGGIFLSPVLNLMRWDTPKNIAATASFFILINSISGLIGQLQKQPHLDWAFTLPLLLSVFVGGQIGSRLSVFKLNQILVRKVTAALVLYAGVNILWTHL
jgi:uncharacterized protein